MAVTVEPGDDSRPVLGDAVQFHRGLLLLLNAATQAALTHKSRAVRLRFGLHGSTGVVRLSVGDVADTLALPECATGTIGLGAEETDAGVLYVLVIPALGAGA